MIDLDVLPMAAGALILARPALGALTIALVIGVYALAEAGRGELIRLHHHC